MSANIKSYKHLFTKTISAAPDRLHFAAHSHHPWPDATFEAQQQYWQDSTAYLDQKWGKIIFPEIIPAAQNSIAKTLNLSTPENIAFAPNTHEFVTRILSCLPQNPRILTTDSEFYSFERQIKRLEEDGDISVNRVAAMPFNTFPARLKAEIAENDYDLVFFSQTFFNAGYVAPDLADIVNAITNKDTLVVIDGYHGYMALPTDLRAIENRAFYIAGGYKYAMAGEGCCFMHCPDGYAMRPQNTGWYADIGALDDQSGGQTPYATNGFRFSGATFDPSGLYRTIAVHDMLARENITIEDIHNHVLALQTLFLEQNKADLGTLITPIDTDIRGNFLTFETDRAAGIHDALLAKNIITDRRKNRLRFGFSITQDANDVKKLCEHLLT
jgi:kynureninase